MKLVIDFLFCVDLFFFSVVGICMVMNVVGIKMKVDKLNDFLWMFKGIVGFNCLCFCMLEFGLFICMLKIVVMVDGLKIILKNVFVCIGCFNMMVIGDMMGVYRVMMKGEKLMVYLFFMFDLIDCNQLINFFFFFEDIMEVFIDSVFLEMKLFVIF